MAQLAARVVAQVAIWGEVSTVIEITAGIGASQFRVCRELGEWGAREMARERQDPGLSPVPFVSRKGALRVTIAWARALPHPRNAVQSTTRSGGADE